VSQVCRFLVSHEVGYYCNFESTDVTEVYLLIWRGLLASYERFSRAG